MADIDAPGLSGDEDAPPVAFTGVLRASGKRFRRQFNPNDWESSILTIRHNVLCLGMSYPCVDNVISNCNRKNKNALPPIIFHNSAPSVERSVELVRRNLLNQIDGRDLARVVALEANNDILAYTVSKEMGSYYDRRHLHADFNSRTLVDQMHSHWGKTVRFRQVILDYFWSPSGSWAIEHWQRSFFNVNIPRLVTEGLLNFGDLENDSVFVSASSDNTAARHEEYISSTAAVVYLPFCSHCLGQVVGCYDALSPYYTISFLRKDHLDEHTLWKATNTISPESMSGWLAKTIDQEETYCKLDARQIRHGTVGDAYVTEEEILEVFRRIDRPEEVRMIKLTALRKFHPEYPKSDERRRATRPTLGLDRGGYVGLMSKRPVVGRRVDDAAASMIPMSKGILVKKVEPTKPRGMIRKRSLSHQQLDKIVTKKQQALLPMRRSISHHQLDKVVEPKQRKMPRKRSLSHHQLDELVGRKREKTDDAVGLLTGPPTGDQNAFPDIALEWDRILTTFEADYERRINRVVGFAPQEVSINFGEKGSNAVEGMERPVASEPAQPIPAKQHLLSTEVVPASTPKNSTGKKPTPPVMARMAKSRCSNPAASGGKIRGSKESEPTDTAGGEDSPQNNESTPNTNDVLLGAHHHSHPGNIQFFSALSLCVHDFSTVAECFVDALKSLDPPGRFLGKDESNGAWACIDYNAAIDFVPHLVDQYALNIPGNISPDNECSSTFLSVVRRLYDAKLKGGESHRNIMGRPSSVSLTDREAVALHTQPLPEAVAFIGESDDPTAMRSAIHNENIFTEKEIRSNQSDEKVESSASKGGEPSAMNNVDSSNNVKSNKGTSRRNHMHDGKKRRGRGKRSALELALSEHKETGNIDISNGKANMDSLDESEGDTASISFINKPASLKDFNPVRGTTENNSTLNRNKMSMKGKPSILAAFAEQEKAKKAITANTAQKVDALNENYPIPGSTSFCGDGRDRLGTSKRSDSPMPLQAPEPASVTESTTIASMNSSNANGLAIPIIHNNTISVNGDSAEEASFKCLAEWLRESTGSTTGDAASMETALRQISKGGDMSILRLLAHAFEEEGDVLRLLCSG